ncbi:MAG: hypothetical protein ACRERS_07150 [Methylococcales bacterium]
MKKFICLASVLFLSACETGTVIIATTCAIDTPMTTSKLSAKKTFNLSGWAFDKKFDPSRRHVRVQFTSVDRKLTKTLVAEMGGKRPDVAAVFKYPNAEFSGFKVEIPANALMPAIYEVTVLQDTSNAVVACGNGHLVEIIE